MLTPRILSRAALVWAAFLFASAGTAAPSRGESPDEARNINLMTFDQVWTTIRDRHFDPDLNGVDWDAVRAELRPLAGKAASKSQIRSILRRMINRLGQSHFQILPGEMYSNLTGGDDPLHPMEQVWDGGCGFEVRIDDGTAVVASVRPGSAVDRAGVAAGWRILQIGSDEPLGRCDYTGDVTRRLIDADGDGLSVVVAGEDGSAVDVDIPLGSMRTRIYQFGGMPPMPVWIDHERLEPNVGYIAFNWFFDPVLVMTRFNKVMESFMDADGIIIDVRGNGGGMASMGAAMIAWFVEEEGRCLGTMIARDCTITARVHPRARTFKGPVAVLINGGSGSATETFAAGIRDVAGARLFGRTTYGGVLPAAFDKLPNGDYFQYAIANYLTGMGEELEGKGVVPDVEMAAGSMPNRLDDPLVEAAIAWIEENKSQRSVFEPDSVSGSGTPKGVNRYDPDHESQIR